MERIKQTEVSPVVILGLLAAVVVTLMVGIYFLFIQPKIVADRALRDFSSAEAQAKRDPDQRKTPAALQAKMDALRAKETHVDAGRYRLNHD